MLSKPVTVLPTRGIFFMVLIDGYGYDPGYIGSKNGNGVLQTIINNIPAHTRYFELFAGSAAIYFAKKSASFNYLCDINSDQVTKLKTAVSTGTIVKCVSATAAIDVFDFTPADFLYLDPPYPFSSRRSNRKLYKYELTDQDHIDLLQSILSIRSSVMISTRTNELYDQALKDWRKVEISTADRGGAVNELIYMNYPVPAMLHQYDYVGLSFTDRQRINRKIERFESKLSMLPAYEKHLFIQELIKNDYAAVRHFMEKYL